MTTDIPVCNICELQHLNTRSMNWCPTCDEALCYNCSEHHRVSKGTRSHKTIHVSQYQSLPTFITNTQQFCVYHKKRYLQYCKFHGLPICCKCINMHDSCDQVVPIEDVISGIKTSELFQNIEQMLKEVLVNIKRIGDDRRENLKSVEIQKKEITTKIESIKTRINHHLDNLKNDFIKELKKEYNNHDDKIQSIISSLKDQEKETKEFITDIENIKKYASNLQTFLCKRDIQSKLSDNLDRLYVILKNGTLKNIDLQLAQDNNIDNVLKIEKFGSILRTERPSENTDFAIEMIRKAQISVSLEFQSMTGIDIEFVHQFDTKCIMHRGCLITRKGGFLFTDFCGPNQKLVELNVQGKNEYTIQLCHPFNAFDVECLNENTVAVTTGNPIHAGQRTGIIIVDLTKREVSNFVDLPGNPYGIAHDGTSMVCCVEDKDIHLISCSDYSITTIPNTVLPSNSYVATHAHKIFYTNPEENKVSCCAYDGTPVWEFIDDKVLQGPNGISLDDRGNVFVVGYNTSNILVISSNGKNYKQILTKENGLLDPIALFFDDLRKQLLVINGSKDAYLFNISHL